MNFKQLWNLSRLIRVTAYPKAVVYSIPLYKEADQLSTLLSIKKEHSYLVITYSINKFLEEGEGISSP